MKSSATTSTPSGGYTVIDHVEKLPEKLPLLFTALTS